MIDTSSKRIAVVVPAYQAAKTIRSVFERLPKEMDQKQVTYYVINDGCTDATVSEVEAVQANRKNVVLVNHEKNKGYAQAQKTGFARALKDGADIVVLLHSDGQYAPELLPGLLAPLESGEADVVQGSRMANPRDALKGGMPLYKWIANRSLTSLENIVYGLKFSEYHSGYMLYSRRTLETVPFMKLSDTFHFDGEMMLVAAKKGMRVKSVPIPTRYADEESHLKPIKYGFDVLKIMFAYLRGRYDFK